MGNIRNLKLRLSKDGIDEDRAATGLEVEAGVDRRQVTAGATHATDSVPAGAAGASTRAAAAQRKKNEAASHG